MIYPVTNLKSHLTAELIASIAEDLNTTGKDFAPEFFLDTWTKLIAHNMAMIWLLERDGIIRGATGAIVSSEPVEGIVVVAQAFLFLVKGQRNPADAVALLNSVEDFGAERNASRVIASVCYDTLDGKQPEFLERRGYSPYETRYYKNLKWAQNR